LDQHGSACRKSVGNKKEVHIQQILEGHKKRSLGLGTSIVVMLQWQTTGKRVTWQHASEATLGTTVMPSVEGSAPLMQPKNALHEYSIFLALASLVVFGMSERAV
jgi:hypothetical protein